MGATKTEQPDQEPIENLVERELAKELKDLAAIERTYKALDKQRETHRKRIKAAMSRLELNGYDMPGIEARIKRYQRTNLSREKAEALLGPRISEIEKTIDIVELEVTIA